ncbi:AMP-binding protein [Bosea sp. (in: a-proteobacteria)]|uniref:AMP-binding protein n=1 Tax=Bosea sp. (in: a-proteobacteria) TaxID=1871050 RepID=UPI00261DF4B4|nr:AMP-binding protein [Bosea sp. (in: a-proteobacteria)]MCO5089548.1 AMP-binding protein [Bosea sp. (in: a-proteobacteria)]
MNGDGAARRPFAWEASYPARIGWDDPIAVCGIGDYLASAVRRYRDRAALQYCEARISYAELGRLVLQAAAGFLALEGAREGGVALLLPNTPWHTICFFGAASADLRIVQLSPMDSIRELEHKLRDSTARIVVTFDAVDYLAKCRELQEKGLIDRIILADDARWGAADETAGVAGLTRLDELIDRAPLPRPLDVDPQGIAVLQYTGGTTGLPKGAALSHANVIAAAEISAHWQSVRANSEGRHDQVLMCLPLFHVFALTMTNRHLGHGNTVHLRRRFEVETALDDIERHRIGIFHGVPTMFIAMLGDARLERRDLSCLDYATSGGAPLPAEVGRSFEARTGIRIHPGWGMSEAAAIGCQHVPGGEIRPGAIGLPLPGIELQVVALEDPSRLLPAGETGEFRMRGPNLFEAYWRREHERDKDFVDGYFRTGDIGHIDADGYVFLTDRKKDMILSSGFNVFPRTVEEAIYEHPDVAECVVIGVPDAYRGQAAKAFIVLKAGRRSFDLDELRAFLMSRLGRHEMPQAMEIRDRLPKTSVGKFSKVALQAEAARAAS